MKDEIIMTKEQLKEYVSTMPDKTVIIITIDDEGSDEK